MDQGMPGDKLYMGASGQDDSFLNSADVSPLGSPLDEAQEAVDPAERERQIEEWKEDLDKTEEEIATLRQVLAAKVKHSSELKRKLGISPLNEIRQDVQQRIHHIKESDTYKKTNDKLHELNDKITQSQAYQKTNQALKTATEKTTTVISTAGHSVARRLSDMRNSNTFKSFEERVGNAYTSVKAKVSGSKSEDNFEQILSETANSEQAGNGVPNPEEKVPL